MRGLQLLGIGGLPRVGAGDDLAGLLRGGLESSGIDLEDGDVLVVCQKVVSKSEGREITLASVTPSADALAIAAHDPHSDPRVVELVLRECVGGIVRRRGSLIIGRTRHGFVCASAGVDLSNTTQSEHAIMLPIDPDASAASIRRAFEPTDIAVVISDSFGRPFRAGTVGVAIGCAGLEPVRSHIDDPDDRGRPFHSTLVHDADLLASAAELLMGPAGGVPACVVRGFRWRPGSVAVAASVIPADRDLFA